MDCNKPIDTAYIGDLPLDTLASNPDFILAERDVEDVTTGNIIRTLVRVPTQKFFPQGTMANVAAIQANNTALDIPEGQVRAGYVGGDGVTRYADMSHRPVFLMLGFATDLLLVQTSGFVEIPEGHDYSLNAQYYASADGTGEPVTDSTSGQKLFIPISKTQLAINLGA